VDAVAATGDSRRVVVTWFVGCLLVTLAAGTIYLVAQQVGRRAADDIPRVLVAQVVADLGQGPATGDLPVSGPASPLSSQSTPFVIVYDPAHAVVRSSVRLDETTPGVPAGVLDEAVSRGETRVTWQPRAGVREAVVAQPWSGPAGSGVVVAGLGLGPTEDRAGAVLRLVLAGWAVAVAALTVSLVALRRSRPVRP
jgi:hypothetical protein